MHGLQASYAVPTECITDPMRKKECQPTSGSSGFQNLTFQVIVTGSVRLPKVTNLLTIQSVALCEEWQILQKETVSQHVLGKSIICVVQ